MSKKYASVADRAGHRCEYCRAPEASFNLAFEVDHITPPSLDGPGDLSNLALASRACNVFKSARQEATDESTGQVVPLFHPRRDRWDEHFRVDLNDGSIQGLSPTGRVTVQSLRLNRDVQRRARQAWMRLKLFP